MEFTVPDHGVLHQTLGSAAARRGFALKRQSGSETCYHISYLEADIKKGKIEVCGQKLQNVCLVLKS